MTGKPFYKTRTITSERLVSPLAGKRDLNDAAIAFKKAVTESITRPTLNAGLSVKALDGATGNETYKDTDGKKRTNKGGTPGMVERLNGYNYLPGQKWEEGKILNLFPSVKLRNTAVKKPNFGWVDEPRSVSADEYAKILAAKPKLRIRKYKVNQKTDEIIEESEQTLDPFSLNGEKTVNPSGYSEKRLPGRTIGQRGRSLIARAASAFGIIVDENGKFRCPPGTPAANQFTDNAGTNCFGISASEIFDFAKRMASGIDVSKETGVKNTTKKLFEFISWLDNGAIPGIGRTVWRDENGKRIKNIKKWREASLNDRNSRVFVDGMIRAQDKLAQQDINIASLMDSLGVIRTDEKRKTNDDVFEVFQKLRDSGAWTIDTSTRLSAEDIDKIVKARLAHVPGFSGLTPERQKSLIAADTERWYTTERALLESALDSFIADPEHMRTIARIDFQVKSPDDPRMDEASTGGYTSPDSKRVMSVIYVDIPEIMNNQEALIPSLAPGERMRIDFVGGKTDSERATALTDFLVTVDGHSKQLAAMVEERAFARHIMKHEIAHTIQMQAFNREAERQIRTNGFITVLNDKGEPVRVENIRDLTSGMVMSLMAKAGDGIDLESLKNALSRTDVVGFLAGEYPKMYFNDEYGAEHWALEAAAELWALRDLGLIYGDDIDAALEWMDDVSDGRYIDIRRRSDADGLREIEARYYENLGPDPELSGNSIAEVRERLEVAHKKELSLIEEWSQDSSTTNDDFIDALAGLEYNREAYNDAFDNLEATGESKDSPAFKNLNRKIKENNAKIALIEKKWAERFSSEDKDRRRSDVKKMRESVREKMFSEGNLRPKEMAARSRQQEIKNLQQQAEDMTEDEFVQKLADIEISLKEPGLSADDKSVLLEDKKMLRAIFKSKLEGSEDSKVWAKQRRELDTRIDEIVNPPRQQALKKTKKVKTDKAGASYAKKIQRDESLAMTEEQAIAVERLGDPELTDIGNLVDPDGNVSAVKNINRRYRRAQRSAGDLSPESETASLEDQIEKVLIPAMEAMDESSIPDDLEIEAEIYFGVTDSGFKDVSEYFDNQSFVSGRIITDESPHKPGEARDADGDVITRAGKEKTRVIVQVSKGDKGLFRTNETELGDEGALVLPPGKMKVVDVRPDGTIVLRVQEQDNVVDVLDRVSSSIGEEGPGAGQHAKGTKKKIDRVANKYVAQRRDNGLSSTPSRPKREVEIEDKNVEVKREVISAGGSFGEPPSEDYVAEIGKAPLIQPAEADIAPDPVDPGTGRPQMKVVSRMSVEELVNRRAAVYRNLLDPDYANDRKGFQGTDRATLKSLDDELAKRGEIITNLPKPPDFDPDHVPGTKKRAPYKTSAGAALDPTTGSEVLGIPQTREERKVVRATRANMTFEDVKRVLAGESPKEVMNDMSRESLDPAVADVVARKSVEAILKDIEDAAVEFHAGIDKRPRVRMTENQLTKFADDGEFLPTGNDDVSIPGDAIGRRLERRLNPGTRREGPKLSSGARYEEKLTSDKTSIDKANKNIRKRETKLRFTNSDGREYSVRIISTNTNRDSYDLPPERELSAYLSDDSGKIVGAFFARSGSTLGRRPEDVDKLVISDITVDENLHRQGLGRAMLTFATKYNVDEEKIYHSNSLSPLGAKFAAGTPIDNNDISLSSGRRNKINRRGPIDRFILEKNKKGDEVRNIKVGTSSISNPEKIDNAEYLKVVGDIPGVSDTDELISTEKLTSSRVPGLEIFRGTYREKKGGEKNRVFGKYKAPDGVEYTMVGTELGMEGRYYAYPPGSERLDPEMDKVAKLSLTLNDGELNVHDLFNIEVNTDKQKLGLAQALVEMAKADFPDATFTTRRVVTDEGAQFARNLQSARGGSSGGSRLSSGRRSGPSRTQRVAGIAGSRATGRVLDAVLKRSGADEDTRERVKYGVNMAGALAAGGPAGFATALAVDVARRAGREIAERGLEEAVQRGRITQNQMDVAMSAVDRVAPNGLPDPVVDKLADAWTIASDFIDERVITDENRQRLDEFGDIIRGEGAELLENAGEIVGSARDKVGKKFKKLKKKKNTEDGIGEDGISDGPDLAELRSRFGSESLPASSEYDDPFDGYNENDYTPAKTEYDPFGDSAFSSGKRAGRSSDAFRDEYNSRIGISKSTPNSAKPVSGYVVHRSHNEEKKRQIAASGKGNIGSDAIFEIGDNDVVGDGLTALGEIEVILKPEVSNRTAYGRGEALQSAHRPVAMNSNDPDDIADAIMNADGISSKKQNTEAMLHLLGAKMDKNFSSVNASMDENGKMAPVGAVDSSARSHEPFEAQILGGFKKNEVEGIHYPYSKVAKIAESEDISDVVNDRSLASKLEKLGFTPEEVAYFYSISGGKPLNTASMVKLKEYRAAKKIKEKYEGMGVGYVKFAHPQGINIENPRSYDKTASSTTRVDEILMKSIDVEVEAELKKTLDNIRKSGQLDLMVD